MNTEESVGSSGAGTAPSPSSAHSDLPECSAPRLPLVPPRALPVLSPKVGRGPATPLQPSLTSRHCTHAETPAREANSSREW